MFYLYNYLFTAAAEKYEYNQSSNAGLSRPLVPEPNLVPWQNLFGSFEFYFV